MRSVSSFVFLTFSFLTFSLPGCGRPDVLAPPCDKGICVSKDGSLSVVAAVAKENEKWVYLDLDTMKEIQVSDPKSNKDWDLAFQRYRIKSNSGVSGTAKVKTAIINRDALKKLAGTPELEDFLKLGDKTIFSKVTKAPSTGYVDDMEDEDGDGENDLAFFQEGAWYDYDFGKHILAPKKRIYVVRTSQKKYIKVMIRSYYSADGSSGTMSFWAQELPNP